jgi:hypothetical protein
VPLCPFSVSLACPSPTPISHWTRGRRIVRLVATRRNVDLDVRFRDDGEVFSLYAEYSGQRYTDSGVGSMLGQLVQLIAALLARPEGRVGDVIHGL